MNLVRKFLNGVTAATVSIVVVVSATAAVALGTTPSQLPFIGSSSDSTSSTSSTSTTLDVTSTSAGNDTSTSSTLISDSAGDSSSNSSSTSSTSSTSTTLATVPSGVVAQDVTVIDAGSVSYVVDGAQLSVVDVSPNDGWTPTVEVAVGREVEVTFRNDGARVDLNLELEHNQIRIRIRDRRTGVRTEVRVPIGGSSSAGSTNPSGTTTSTIPGTDSATAPVTQHSIQAAGGTVVVSVSGDTVLLVSAVPATGYSVDVRKAGPSKVEVRFESGDAESRVEVRADHGQVRKSVEDR